MTLRDILRSSTPCSEEKLFGGKIGNGTLGEPNDGETMIEIPDEVLINETYDRVSSIISFTYPNILDNVSDSSYFQDRVILAPTHEVVDTINEHMLSMMPGEETVYFSSDSICESEETTNFDRRVTFSL
ncbi:ATP-dependent DNA helicase PIF1-like protein [Tanacetum coccineum]|uniref:ATP-dependent DNA helicase PIF1-like protein n=1 Tax=Tanacetum coccineum TaxID=301880 RepID=A0ABQ5IIL3_9ASTR